MINISLTTDQAQELMIALRDRASTLREEIAEGSNGKLGAATIANIASRQLERLRSAAEPIAAELGESF